MLGAERRRAAVIDLLALDLAPDAPTAGREDVASTIHAQYPVA